MRAKVGLLALAVGMAVHAQQNFFVDGFHGGVYGHYPMKTYTQFMVDQLKSHPDWYIGLEIEPETWDTVRVKTPDAYVQFQQVAGSRQVEFTNPSYAQSYLYCIDGESIIRQFEYGIRKVRSHFPDARIETYACEEPCFTSCLPTILPMFGFKYLSLKCPDTCWGGYSANFGGEFVNLIGPDGTGMPCVPRYACEELQEKSVWQTTAWSNNRYFWEACREAGIEHPVGMCYQDAGWTGGPWIKYGSRLKFGTQYTLWSDYFRKYQPRKMPKHRFEQEDVRPGLMWGAQILQQLAQQCRRAEISLLQTEKLLAMARLDNGFTWDQSTVDEAWRKLLLSQHHDCWIVPYNHLNEHGNWADNVKRWTAAAEYSMRQLQQQAGRSMNNASGNSEKGIRFYNTTGTRRHEVLEADDYSNGRHYFLEADLPAFGYLALPYSQIPSVEKTHSIQLTDEECVLENEQYSIRFDLRHGGTVTSLKDKRSGYEYADTTGTYRMGELRGWFKEDGTWLSTADTRATATILCDNALCKSIQIHTEIKGTPVCFSYKLKKGSPVIDASLLVQWRESHPVGKMYDTRYDLNLMLPTAFHDGKVSKAAPFDVCESGLKDTFFDDWHQIKHNLINEWLDLYSTSRHRGLGLLCDHTTSYSYGKDFPLALTVQYSGPGLWGRNYAIKEETGINFALVPHKGRWDKADLWTVSNQWSEKVLVQNDIPADRRTEKSFLDLTDTGKQLTSVTLRNDTLKARIFNASTKKGRFQVQTIRLR